MRTISISIKTLLMEFSMQDKVNQMKFGFMLPCIPSIVYMLWNVEDLVINKHLNI